MPASEGDEKIVKVSFMLLAMLSFAGLCLVGCRIEQETSPTGPGTGGGQVIKFENITRSIPVLVKIPDAHHEFELAVNEKKTVEVYSEEGATVFYVEIFENFPGRDISTARRWTGFVAVGKVVTIRQRLCIQIEIHD